MPDMNGEIHEVRDWVSEDECRKPIDYSNNRNIGRYIDRVIIAAHATTESLSCCTICYFL